MPELPSGFARRRVSTSQPRCFTAYIDCALKLAHFHLQSRIPSETACFHNYRHFMDFAKSPSFGLWFVSLDAVRFSIGNDNGADNNNPTRAVLSRITVTLVFFGFRSSGGPEDGVVKFAGGNRFFSRRWMSTSKQNVQIFTAMCYSCKKPLPLSRWA